MGLVQPYVPLTLTLLPEGEDDPEVKAAQYTYPSRDSVVVTTAVVEVVVASDVVMRG